MFRSGCWLMRLCVLGWSEGTGLKDGTLYVCRQPDAFTFMHVGKCCSLGPIFIVLISQAGWYA